MSARRQRGLVALLLAAAILTSVATALVIRQANSVRQAGDQISVTNARLEAVRKAMVYFVMNNGRLPCPADGDIAIGLATAGAEARTAATGACTAMARGVAPWVTLGLLEAEGQDAWGRRLSYKVYAGVTGLTVDGGALITNCDSDFATPALTPASAAVGPAFLCAAPPATRTLPDTVLDPVRRPGLPLTDHGVAIAQVGFVLVSHGATGRGAWLPGGGRMALPVVPPAPATNPETPNTLAPSAGVIYARRNASDKTIGIDQPALYFDDIVIYMTIQNLLSAAGTTARNW